MSTRIRAGALGKSLAHGKISSSLQKTIRKETGAKNIGEVRKALASGLGGKSIKGRSSYLKKLKVRAQDIKRIEDTITPREENMERKPSKMEMKAQKKAEDLKKQTNVQRQLGRGSDRQAGWQESTKEFGATGKGVKTKSRIGTNTKKELSSKSIFAQDNRRVLKNNGVSRDTSSTFANINSQESKSILNKKETEEDGDSPERMEPPMGF